MAKKEVEFHEAASEEFEAAFDWYWERSAGAAARFAGEVSRGEAKTPNQEGYRVIRGTLKQYDEDESKHVSAKERELTLKSFPQDVEADQQPK